MRLVARCLLVILALGAWGDTAEVAVRILPIADDLFADNPEYSGLAWWGERLVLLPETARENMPVFTREQLITAIDSGADRPLEAQRIPLELNGALDKISTIGGFEAIVFNGEEVYIALETLPFEMDHAYILCGTAKDDKILLDPARVYRFPLSTSVPNFSVEALLWWKDALIGLHEINGVNVLPKPHAFRWKPPNAEPSKIPSSRLEYRLTDATAPDASGHFWVTNYFYTREAHLLEPQDDALAAKFGKGQTHAASEKVERLVEMVIDGDGVRITDTPPIQLALDDSTGRNWEGIARLGDRGFLIITDRWPRTLFGFVPFPAR